MGNVSGDNVKLTGSKKDQPPEDTFYIGLSMAGAISAGAYSAGVFDMLMEALEAWQQKKDEEINNAVKTVPTHNVVISVISGASAGGIVGALGAVALADGEGTKKAKDEGKPYTLPRLYHAWVTMPQFASTSGHPDFLQRDDLDKSELKSLLNKNLLPKICQRSFERFPAKIANARPYIAENLHLFLTHTNLNGVPYGVPFKLDRKDKIGYPMQNHADRVHYRLAGLGNATFSSEWADPDPTILQDFNTLHQFKTSWSVLADPRETALSQEPWVQFINNTLATGAFPIALQARIISTNTDKQYEQRQWPIVVSEQYKAQHQFRLKPEIKPTDDAIPYLAVDGGMTNNEPFELCRFTLMENPPYPNPRSEDNQQRVNRAVIMVDPFPEPEKYTQHSLASLSNDTEFKQLNPIIVNVLKKLFPTLKNQARCKFDEMTAAYDEDVYSRFLIAPHKKDSEHPLACGLLGGFGGFLSEKLRAHDYQLGRYNCYNFLKNHFGLPNAMPSNIMNTYEVVHAGYVLTNNTTAIDRRLYFCGDPDHLQIIPIMPEVTQPTIQGTEHISRQEFDTFIEQCKKRTDAIFNASRKELGVTGMAGMAAKLYWKFSASSKIRKIIQEKLAAALIEHGLATENYAKKPRRSRFGRN